ncbi:hypothetical protein [Nocardioides terrisoli]|uniref:hypothetical protein n=1 Tax=Nocardioides terrisoli TaxID=3388267 RepID=UPI00287BC9D2|nr:hypothetical protein [Nocardioides marmorisolisilvae]
MSVLPGRMVTCGSNRTANTEGACSRRRRAAAARPSAADPVLDQLVALDAEERRVGIAKLQAVLDWAHAHPGTPGDCASWDPALLVLDAAEDALDNLGGEGTPAVAEFAVDQLAARLDVSTGQAMSLVADTLNLAHRHPRLWARVQSGGVPVWLGRKIATACCGLPAEAAAYVDTHTAHLAGRVAWRRIDAQIAYATAKWRPDTAAEAERQASDSRHVKIAFPTRGRPGGDPARPGDIAAADLYGRLSTTDALKFDALVAAKAAELAAGGDTDPLDVRRAKALGLIADQLMTGELDLQLGAVDGGDPQRRAVSDRRSCLPATLHLHVRAEDLAAHLAASGSDSRLGVVERLGPATLDLLADWLGETDLVVRPVLDMGRTDAVDHHDPPAWMRELVILRDRHCVFPHCARDARSCDLDHVDPYVPMDQGGPPGQTTPANLAPFVPAAPSVEDVHPLAIPTHPNR